MEALQQSLELLPDAVVILDARGAIVWHNRRMAPWLPAGVAARCEGASAAQSSSAESSAAEWTAAEWTAAEWLSAGSSATLQQALAAVPASPALELELELAGPEGRWLSARARPLSGAVKGAGGAGGKRWLVTLREHTRSCAEQQARDTELRRLRHAVSTRAIGIYEHDHASNEIYASHALRVQYALDAERRLTIADFAGATHPHDSEFLLGEIAKAHDPQRDGSFDVLHRILIPSGETRWLHTRATTTFRVTEDGQRLPAKTLGSCIEITREHENELAIRRLAAILDASPDVVATTHLDGRLTYLNPAGRRLLGLAPGAALEAGHHILGLLWHERRQQFEEQVVPGAIARGQWRGELELRGQDGRPFAVSLVVLALEQPRSAGAYLSVIAHDLSSQKQLEAQLRHAQKLEAVGRLAGGIAHDFNNLLSVVFSFASLVRQHPQLPEQARAHTDEILRAGKRAADLTSQLLSFSRKQVLEPRVVSVERVLSRLLPMVERLVGETIRVRLSLGEDELRVKVDPGQLELMLMNLVVNARDAMPNGGQLQISAEPCVVPEGSALAVDLSAGEYVALHVSDDGCGISAELLPRIFEPFFTTKSAGEGTGLGLSTVFGIAAQSGGTVQVKSEELRGSTFSIYLPRSSEPLHGATQPPPLLPAARGGVVLVVEDEAQLRGALLAVLEQAGYQPIAAAGPLEALELVRLRESPVDLVLTDIVMPDLRGQQLAERLAAAGSTAPVLYMSGYTGDSAPGQDVLQGSVGFLAKPFTAEQLLQKLAQVLGTPAAAAEPEPR